MNAEPVSVRESLVRQAFSCRSIGSPLYATLLEGLTTDYDGNGVTADLLDGVSAQPQHDALPLRYLACAHRLALAGRAADLARHFPSCGGTWDGSPAVVADFLTLAAAEIDEFRNGVRRNVQTNEVGRAAVLASGFALIARRHGLPIAQLEIGSAAGLLSRWDHFRFDTGRSQAGDPASPVVFGPEWWAEPRPELTGQIIVARRRASDISPIDINTSDGRMTSMSFVWPDQTARFDRLAAAIDIAQRHWMDVERGDAGDWLTTHLAAGPSTGHATVVFHSIVWQYLPQGTRERVRAAIMGAGARATTGSAMLWMRMEPAGAHADLRLTTWPGGGDEVLAHVGYHGADIRWLVE
ncbi:MAG: DUF2332 domain-containing protein [Ilumatobacteraceae bacterium]